MIISLLLSLLIFSLAIVEKGVIGAGLDFFNTLGWVVAYSIPIFIIELIVKIFLMGAGKLKLIAAAFLNSIWIALLSDYLWYLSFTYLYKAQGEESLMALAVVIYILPLFVIDFIIFLFIYYFRNNIGFAKKTIDVISKVNFILFFIGVVLLAKCNFVGCMNPSYRAARAQKADVSSYCYAGTFDAEDLRIKFDDIYFYLLPPRQYNNPKECFRLLAEKKNDPEICKSIGFGFDQKDCLINIAKKLSDTSICNKFFSDDRDKIDCLKQINIDAE